MSTSTKEQVEQAPGEGTGTPFSVWLALAVGLFVAISWSFPSWWMGITGIVLIIAAWLMLIRPERRLALAAILLALALLITYLMPNISRITEQGRNAAAKANLHCIQLSLERYAEDKGDIYPLTIDQLRQEEYLDYLPRYPYNNLIYQKLEQIADRRNTTVESLIPDDAVAIFEQMQPLGADYFPKEYKAQLSPVGNFCYVPRIETGPDGELTATGYLLIGFGQKRWHPDWTTPPRNIPTVLMQLTDKDQIPSPYY